jgi:hypothetical protein
MFLLGFSCFFLFPLPMQLLEEYTNRATTTQFHILSNSLSVNLPGFLGSTGRATEVIKYITNSWKINLEEVKFTIFHIDFELILAFCRYKSIVAKPAT